MSTTLSETTENPIRTAIADAIGEHEAILFMKGTPERPMCGFSAPVSVKVIMFFGTPRRPVGPMLHEV